MGETERGPSTAPAFRILARLEREMAVEDGAVASDRSVWGTYLHGLFDNDGFRRRFIESLQERKDRMNQSGVGATGRSPLLDYRAFKENEYDKLAAALREALDMKQIYRIIGRK